MRLPQQHIPRRSVLFFLCMMINTTSIIIIIIIISTLQSESHPWQTCTC